MAARPEARALFVISVAIQFLQTLMDAGFRRHDGEYTFY